jgi:hypothetical protein
VGYKVAYTVQPNGGGKELHIKFESDDGVHLLDEIATAALLKATLTLFVMLRLRVQEILSTL